MKWRIAVNPWNLKGAPWRGAVGIEEDDETVAVPAMVAWFMRGDDLNPVQVVGAHNVLEAASHKTMKGDPH